MVHPWLTIVNHVTIVGISPGMCISTLTGTELIAGVPKLWVAALFEVAGFLNGVAGPVKIHLILQKLLNLGGLHQSNLWQH